MFLLDSRKFQSASKCIIFCSNSGCCCTRNGSVADCGHLSWCLGKNASFLRVVCCRSLAEEYSVDSVNKDEIGKFEISFLSNYCYSLVDCHFMCLVSSNTVLCYGKR